MKPGQKRIMSTPDLDRAREAAREKFPPSIHGDWIEDIAKFALEQRAEESDQFTKLEIHRDCCCIDCNFRAADLRRQAATLEKGEGQQGSKQ